MLCNIKCVFLNGIISLIFNVHFTTTKPKDLKELTPGYKNELKISILNSIQAKQQQQRAEEKNIKLIAFDI